MRSSVATASIATSNESIGTAAARWISKAAASFTARAERQETVIVPAAVAQTPLRCVKGNAGYDNCIKLFGETSDECSGSGSAMPYFPVRHASGLSGEAAYINPSAQHTG